MGRAILKGESGEPTSARLDLFWSVLGVVGWAFLLAGGSDLFLAWVPPNLGNPEWEFGTISASLDAMPLPTMGLVFILGSAVVRRRRVLVRGVGVTFAVLALVVVGWDVLYGLAAPVGLQSVPEGPVRVGLLKAVAKAAAQGVIYPVVFALIAVKALRTQI